MITELNETHENAIQALIDRNPYGTWISIGYRYPQGLFSYLDHISERYHVLGTWRDDQLIAIATVSIQERCFGTIAYLSNLKVDAPFRGQGVLSAALPEAARFIENLGIRYLVMSVSTDSLAERIFLSASEGFPRFEPLLDVTTHLCRARGDEEEAAIDLRSYRLESLSFRFPLGLIARARGISEGPIDAVYLPDTHADLNTLSRIGGARFVIASVPTQQDRFDRVATFSYDTRIIYADLEGVYDLDRFGPIEAWRL